MRAFELSTLALTLLAGGMPWLFACASAPRPGASPSGAAAAASGGATSGAAAMAPGQAGGAAGDANAPSAEGDPHSFARPSEVAVDHLVLDLSVDFAARRLSGRASPRLRRTAG